MNLTSSLITDIVRSLHKQSNEMIWSAFKDCGFSEKYVMDHLDEFRVEKVIGSSDEDYFHKEKYLFTFKLETDIDSGEIKMVIYYPVNHEISLKKKEEIK